ncbi:MAG: ferredoxin [Acidimicrobiales bacterium]
MPIIEVELDQSVCCGGRQCVAAAPDAFEYLDKGIAAVRPTAGEVNLEQLVRAARNCPVMCITIRRDGEVIEPP